MNADARSDTHSPRETSQKAGSFFVCPPRTETLLFFPRPHLLAAEVGEKKPGPRQDNSMDRIILLIPSDIPPRSLRSLRLGPQ